MDAGRSIQVAVVRADMFIVGVGRALLRALPAFVAVALILGVVFIMRRGRAGRRGR